MDKIRVAIIDLDGTLLRRTSSEHAFFRFLLVRRKIGLIRLTVFLSTFLKDTMRFGLRQAIGRNACYLRGVKLEEVLGWARDYGRIFLRAAIPDALQQRIHRFKSEGCLIILLSSSLQILVNQLKEKLGADIMIGRELEIEGGRLTGRRVGIYPHGPQKVEALFQKIKSEDVDWEHSWALADRLSDLPVLELVGNPVAVHPQGKLRRFARKRGWEIIP